MTELRLPLDYEQLPELWQLRSILSKKLTDSKANVRQVEQFASFMFHRLFVTLGYLARSTNEPGLLTQTGAEQFIASLEPLFGEDCNALQLLENVKLLVSCEGGWRCDLFVKCNSHLAGDYKAPHIKGNVNSRLSAAHKRIVVEATQQGLLLPSEIFKKRDGKPMNDSESKRCLILVRMLDRILHPGTFRAANAFTEGMMATACAVVEAHEGEELKQFYFWLGNGPDHPAIPKTTEQMLERFEEFFPLSKQQ